jgi:hypothetical protein
LAARILASHPAETELYRHGVTWLQTMNIEALEAIRDRLGEGSGSAVGTMADRAGRLTTHSAGPPTARPALPPTSNPGLTVHSAGEDSSKPPEPRLLGV